MNKPVIYIGIDPDLILSGVAILNKENDTFALELLSFLSIIRLFEAYPSHCMKVRVEAGYLNTKANHHNRAGQSKEVGERIAKNVGENHAVGKLIVQVCRKMQIEYEEVRPTTSKVNPQFFKQFTGQSIKNQELIDAGMLVFGL